MIHIVISGGGVAGAGLACALSDLVESGKLEITVIEKETEDDIGFVKRGQVLRPEATKLIYDTGLIEYFKKKNPVLKPSPKEELWHSSIGYVGSFDYEIFAKGYPMMYLPHPLIVEALHERMKESNIRVVYGAESTGIEKNDDGKMGLKYRTKQSKSDDKIHSIVGDLLVVADGATSALRAASNIQIDFYDYKSGYLVVILDKFEGFESDRFCISQRGFIPIFSMPDEKIRAMIEIRTEDLREWMALSPERLQMRLAEWIPELASSRVREIGSYYHVIRRAARSYVSDHTVLIGDSAHTTHPMLGQGMSMVFNDVSILSSIIRSDPARSASFDALNRYEQMARPFDESVLRNSHELHEAILEIGKSPISIQKYGELLKRVGFQISPDVELDKLR